MSEHPESITPEYFRKVREVFESALERPAEERCAFIQRMCDDPATAAEVERMLAAEDQCHDLIDRDQVRSKVGICAACKSEIGRAH